MAPQGILLFSLPTRFGPQTSPAPFGSWNLSGDMTILEDLDLSSVTNVFLHSGEFSFIPFVWYWR